MNERVLTFLIIASLLEFSTLDCDVQPVFVDFSATWCGPCQRIGPVFHKLADEYGDKCVCIKIDVDDNEVGLAISLTSGIW